MRQEAVVAAQAVLQVSDQYPNYPARHIDQPLRSDLTIKSRSLRFWSYNRAELKYRAVQALWCTWGQELLSSWCFFNTDFALKWLPQESRLSPQNLLPLLGAAGLRKFSGVFKSDSSMRGRTYKHGASSF